MLFRSGFFPSSIYWLLVIFLLWWAIFVGLFFGLYGFRLVASVNLVWVPIVPMVAVWLCGLCWVYKRDDNVWVMLGL